VIAVEIINRCCAGLDVHKKTVVACVRALGPDGKATNEARTFGTMTAELLALADWLEARGARQVAMESTGVSWKPVFYVLEGRFEVMVVNARHIKNVPGRKTDVKDAEWVAQLLQHGLLRPSFIPPPPVRELRDLTRQRAQLVRDRVTVVNRVQKVLEDANIKLASVATDVLGVSGRAMIRELIAGNTVADDLAALARARLRAKLPALRQALDGRVTEHHRFQLRMLMEQVEHLEGWIAELGTRIEALMRPFSEASQRLALVPGVGQRSAEVIVAEIGTDMTKFPSAGHLASWAGLCPGNDQSAGKRRSGKTTKGSQWLRTTLVQVAWAASHTKETVFAAAYRRWAKRLGKKKALVAVAHKILVVVYRLLKDKMDYQERWSPAQAG
jgi:transposase